MEEVRQGVQSSRFAGQGALDSVNSSDIAQSEVKYDF